MLQYTMLFVGAVNVDWVHQVERLPAAGETVVASAIRRMHGGKASNQAVAAARALSSQGRVILVGAVGDDEDGTREIDALDDHGVDTRLVRRVVGTPTGSATVMVDSRGENCIVLIPGANAFVSGGNLYGAPAADVVVVQTEVSAAAVSAAVEHARVHGSRLVLNNAPVQGLSTDTYAACDPLVVNEGEARTLLRSIHPNVPKSQLARDLLDELGCRSVVVTLGRDGCAWATRQATGAIPGQTTVEVVDTTGAGDTFVGALAAHLAQGKDLGAAADAASDAATQSVRWEGTRPPLSVGASG